MPLTRPIPDSVMPVVEAIRRDVTRPDHLPMPTHGMAGKLILRWCARWHAGRYCCPMGLHPLAKRGLPLNLCHLPLQECTSRQINAFGTWWDEQTDAVAAVDAVWPPETHVS